MKFFNVLGVCFIKICFIVYCSGEESFEKVLNDYKPEIDLPSEEISYLRGIPSGNLKAAVQRSKDMEEYKAKNYQLVSEKAVLMNENAAIKSENAEIKSENAEIKSEKAAIKSENVAINHENENYKLSCTFTKGRRINEDLLKNITDYEHIKYGKNLTRLFNDGLNLMRSGTVKIPEDLSTYPVADSGMWKKCKDSYYYHWVQYFTKCTDKHAVDLRKFLDKKNVVCFEFAWAMAKTYTVLCDYVHTRTQSDKMMDTQAGYQKYVYLDLIKQHNNWILTTRDLKYLDYAAEFTGNFKIDNFEWFDEKKKLAIPILKSGNPVLITKCPAVVQDDKYVVLARRIFSRAESENIREYSRIFSWL